MGSFNTSCMVSQQIIVPGTEVIILPIHQQATYDAVELVKDDKQVSSYGMSHSSCYPTAFWGYAGPMIAGTYNDYGCFLLDDTEENISNLLYFFQELQKSVFETKQGENPYHDHGIKMDEIYNHKATYTFDQLVEIWDKIFEVAQENRLFIESSGVPRNLNFAVIHHITAKYLIDTVNNMKSYSGQSYEQKSYFNDYINHDVKRMMEIFGDKKESGDIFSFFTAQLGSLSNYALGSNEGTYLSQYYNSFNEVMDIMEPYTSSNILKEVTQESIDQLFEVFKSQLNHRHLHMGLVHYNIKLSPMVSASQDYDNTTGKDYAKMIRAVSSQINKEIKENYLG